MAGEQGEALVGVGVPNAQAVVFTSTDHQTSVLVGLNVANSTPVTLELALTFKKPALPLGGGVEVQHLSLGVLSSNHEYISRLSVVLDGLAVVEHIGLPLRGVLESVRSADELLSLGRGDVHHTLESGRNDVLLIVREVAGEHHSLGLSVNEHRFGGLALVEQADVAVGATGGDLVSVVAKNRVVCLKISQGRLPFWCGRAAQRPACLSWGPTLCRLLRGKRRRTSFRRWRRPGTRCLPCYR